MDFAGFTEQISNEISRKTGRGYKVQFNDVRKNNGVILRGLTVMQDGINVSPTIYLNNYFDEYVNGEVTLSDVVRDVMDTYSRNRIKERLNMQYLLDYEQVKQHIIYKLINTERNRELLEDVPHVEYLDLSIVFQCMITHKEFGTASILIHNAHQKMWDVSVDALYQAARENTQKLMPYVIKPINEVMCEVMKSQNPEQFDHDAYMAGLSDCIPMFMISNKNRMDGAACMLYHNLFRDFSEKIGSSFFVIPSSIHELLLLPDENADDSGIIKSMIREINDTQLLYEEILSYSLYFFDRARGEVIIL